MDTAQQVSGVVGALFVPGLFIVLAMTLVLTARYVISRYKKVPPGRVGIFYGRRYKWADGKERGFMLMSGGGRVQRPVVEEYLEIPTTAFQVSVSEKGIPNMDNVPFNVGGVATCKVSTDPGDLVNAVEALIDKLKNSGQQSARGEANEAVTAFVLNILKGHLRGIIGKLDVNELLRDRDEFNKKVMAESKVELKSLGIDLMSLVVQDIDDAEGYIKALGKRAVAEAKAEAEIKTAEATRRQDIEVSHAQRESAVVKAENEAKIADSEKQRDVQKAKFKVEAETENAKAEAALAIETAAQERLIKVAQAERDTAEKKAQILTQEQEGLRKSKELEATVVAQAEATKRVTILTAEGEKQRRITSAEAEAREKEITAQAKKNAAIAEGEGSAAAIEANLMATARGRAAEKKEALLAEAEGTKQLAEALKQLSDKGQMIIVLDKLPALMTIGGEALAKVAKEVFTGIAAPLGQIDNFNIVEFGSNGHSTNGNGTGNGGGVLERLTSLSPTVIAQALAAMKTMGVDPSALLKAVGVDMSGFNNLFNGLEPSGPVAGNGADTSVTGVVKTPAPSRSGRTDSGRGEAHPA